MPEYVAQIREIHREILRYATLEPELPTWSVIRKGIAVSEMGKGSSARETSGTEKGASEEKEKAAVHLKRRSETEADEPKAKIVRFFFCYRELLIRSRNASSAVRFAGSKLARVWVECHCCAPPKNTKLLGTDCYSLFAFLRH